MAVTDCRTCQLDRSIQLLSLTQLWPTNVFGSSRRELMIPLPVLPVAQTTATLSMVILVCRCGSACEVERCYVRAVMQTRRLSETWSCFIQSNLNPGSIKALTLFRRWRKTLSKPTRLDRHYSPHALLSGCVLWCDQTSCPGS